MASQKENYGESRMNSDSKVMVVKTLNRGTAFQLQQQIREDSIFISKFVVDLSRLQLEQVFNDFGIFVGQMLQGEYGENVFIYFCGKDWMSGYFKGDLVRFSTATSDEVSVVIKDYVPAEISVVS